MKKVSEYNSLLKSLLLEWKWLFRYMIKYRVEILIYIVIGVSGTLMGLGTSLFSKHLIDAVVTHNNEKILPIAAVVVGLAFSQIVISAGISRLTSVVSTRIHSEVRADIYDHIVLSKWINIKKYHSGELVNRLEGDAGAVSSGIVSFVPGVFTRCTQFFGCLAIVLYYDATMAVFALMSAPILFFSSRFMTKMMRKYNLESREVNGKIISYTEVSIFLINSSHFFARPESVFSCC